MIKEDILLYINDNITDNNSGAITAQVMRDVLGNIVNENYNQGYTYIGTATPSTTPMEITAEDKVFYIAVEEGDYTGFGQNGITELTVLKSDNGRWVKEGLCIDFLSSAAVDEFKYAYHRWLLANGIKNWYDEEDLVEGYKLDTQGNLVETANWYVTPLLPVVSGRIWKLRSAAAACFYDINYKFVRYYSVPSTGILEVPQGAYWVRIHLYSSWLGGLYIGDNDYYVDNRSIQGRKWLPSDIRNLAINTDHIQNQAVHVNQTNLFRVVGKNLCNPNDSGYIPFAFLNTGGRIGESSSTDVTPYIPFTQEMEYLVASTDGVATSSNYTICLFDKDYNVVNNIVGSVATWEEGVAYARFSARKGNIQVEVGQVATPYEPYQATLKDEYIVMPAYDDVLESSPILQPVFSSVMQSGIRNQYESLSAGNSVYVTEYPNYVKKTGTVSAWFKFSTWASGNTVSVGFDSNTNGLGNGLGLKMIISDTQVKLSRSGNVYTTLNHGLTFNEFVCTTMSRDMSGDVHIIIETLNGSYIHTESNVIIETYGKPFIITDIEMTDVTLSAYNEDFRKPIWVVGDSYTSLYGARWVYQMQESYGIKNWMLQGLAGGGSPGMFSDLQLSLNFGTPKYLVWCLGMNDDYDTWLSVFTQLETLCREKGIELIAATIPTTPTRSMEDISNYVRNSGHRYIDFYKAVGTNSSGVWYDGCLDDDNVHPTEVGAKALAARVLVDLPEIINFEE